MLQVMCVIVTYKLVLHRHELDTIHLDGVAAHQQHLVTLQKLEPGGLLFGLVG